MGLERLEPLQLPLVCVDPGLKDWMRDRAPESLWMSIYTGVERVHTFLQWDHEHVICKDLPVQQILNVHWSKQAHP